MERNRSMMTSDVIIILASIWLFISPWVLDYGDSAGWNSTICAVVVAILAILRLAGQERQALFSQIDWLSALIGIWLIVAPWVIDGYTSQTDKWSTVAMGIIILVFAAASEWMGMGMAEHEHRPAM